MGAYRSFNCFALLKQHTEIPAALDFAAAATVLLAHFHIRDQQVDTCKTRWRVAAAILSPAYRRVAARLKSWDFPLDILEAVLGTQSAREAVAQSLEHVSEPTAVATALVFSHGAHVIGRSDLVDIMYRLGHLFGHLIYLLDAVEDLEKDKKSGNFQSAVGVSSNAWARGDSRRYRQTRAAAPGSVCGAPARQCRRAPRIPPSRATAPSSENSAASLAGRRRRGTLDPRRCSRASPR
jgi:hypothetical protein